MEPKKKLKKYYCSKHGAEGKPTCQECINKLTKMAKDYNVVLIGDIK